MSVHHGKWIAPAAAYVLLGAVGVAAWSAFLPVRVAGRSMEPALHSGDVVVVARARRPSRQDIVMVDSDTHGPFIHRVTRVLDAGRLITKGDANPIADFNPVNRSDVVGTVVGVVPVGRLLGGWRGQ